MTVAETIEQDVGLNPTDDWREWPVEQKRRFLLRLREQVHGTWRDRARPEQLPPTEDWITLFLRGGRGSGKTWAGGHILREEIETDPLLAERGPGEWAVRRVA